MTKRFDVNFGEQFMPFPFGAKLYTFKLLQRRGGAPVVCFTLIDRNHFTLEAVACQWNQIITDYFAS